MTELRPTTKRVRYKWCVVAWCTSTTYKTPEKVFVHVPDNVERRNAWIIAAGRDARKGKFSLNTTLYCCQDHFNMQEDMENFMQFKMMTGCKLRCKKSVVPHIFAWPPQHPASSETGHSDIIATDQDLFYSRVKEESVADSLALTAPAHATWIKEEPLEVDAIPIAVADSWPLADAASSTADEERRVSSVYDQRGEDMCWWEVQEAGVDPVLLSDEKQDVTEHTTCSTNATPAFVEVVMDSDFKMEEPASSEVDPLLLPCLKTEDEGEVPTNLTGAASGIKEEEIECDPQQSESTYWEMCEETCASPDDLNQDVSMSRVVQTPGITAQTFVQGHTCVTCGQHFSRKTVYAKHLLRHSVAVSDAGGHGGVSRKNISCQSDHDDVNHKEPRIVVTGLERCDAQRTASAGFVCDVCGKVFVLERYLRRHLYNHDDYSSRMFACGEGACDKRFKTNWELQGHQTVHSDARPFSCDECDFRSKWKSDLQRHMRAHSVNDESMFHCTKCRKNFTKKDQLNGHVYSCDYRKKVHETQVTGNCIKRSKANVKSHADEKVIVILIKNV